MSVHINELRVREIASRMGGNRLQQRFIELVWTPERHLFINSKLPDIMDALDGLRASELSSLIKLLERPGYSNNAIAAAALMTCLKYSYSLARWTNLMESHFERMKSDYLANDVLSLNNMLNIMEWMTQYYRDGMLRVLTTEQEWAVIAVSAETFHKGVFFRPHPIETKSFMISSKPLMDYIIDNAHRNDEITKAIAEHRITVPAQIDAYLAGNRTALLEGAL